MGRKLRFLFWAWFILVNVFATSRAIYFTFCKGILTEPYQIWWAGAIGVLKLILGTLFFRSKLRVPGPPWLLFASSALFFSMAEELTCYLVKTGIFHHMD